MRPPERSAHTQPVLPLEAASKAELQAATKEYEAGLAAMRAEKCAEALERFKNSNDKVSSPNSRMMIGRALIKLGRLADAFRELSRAAEDTEALAKSKKRYRKTVETATAEPLWAELSGSKLGAAFRRQFVIAPFIVDLYCASLRLVVEVDGGCHGERQAVDARRDGKLCATGDIHDTSQR